ncbi:MAG: FkbM family methyltransferase [Ramlibacter sp.]|nr:FkbM family methyltransferase [Ramlibacter sp.]
MPFVDNTRLLVKSGMTGATGNIYCGLHEFEDMAFVLHLLRPGDLFVDVGANIGSYSILGAAAGATVISFEPVPSTFEWLLDNVHLNRFQTRIDARNLAVGASSATIRMIADRDTTNQVLQQGASYAGASLDVQQVALDDALPHVPKLIKIDVEGFEANVIEGGRRLLADRSLHAVVMELNGSGEQFGNGDDHVLNAMRSFGFTPCNYDPLKRRLTVLTGKSQTTGNTLFVRSPESAQALVASSRTFGVQGCLV